MTLCDNLREGGVEEDALRTLWGGDDETHVDLPPQSPATPKYSSSRSITATEKQKPDAAAASAYGGQDTTSSTRSSDLFSDDGRDDASAGAYDFEDSNIVDKTSSPPCGSAASSRTTGPERQSLRTIQLMSLPEVATLADVAAAVRGGPLLELYIRAHDRSAFVSFVRGPDAKEFFDHVRKHDLYIKTKRVSTRRFFCRNT